MMMMIAMSMNQVATHQKTQQGLKQTRELIPLAAGLRRNASENPAGIETLTGRIHQTRECSCRNASENPAGIETFRPR